MEASKPTIDDLYALLSLRAGLKHEINQKQDLINGFLKSIETEKMRIEPLDLRLNHVESQIRNLIKVL